MVKHASIKSLSSCSIVERDGTKNLRLSGSKTSNRLATAGEEKERERRERVCMCERE